MTTREIAACRKSFQHLIVVAFLEMFDDKVFTAIRQDIISHFQQQKKIQGASLIVAAFAESLLCERLSSVVRGGAFDFLMRFFFLILVVRVSISNSTCFSSSCRGTMATQRFCNNEKKSASVLAREDEDLMTKCGRGAAVLTRISLTTITIDDFGS